MVGKNMSYYQFILREKKMNDLSFFWFWENGEA